MSFLSMEKSLLGYLHFFLQVQVFTDTTYNHSSMFFLRICILMTDIHLIYQLGSKNVNFPQIPIYSVIS